MLEFMDEETRKKLHMLVGSKVREARTGRFSQEQLAGKIKLKRTTVTSIEKGHHRVSLDTLWNIANILDLKVPELLPEPEEVNLTFAEIVKRTLTPSQKRWYDDLRGSE